MNKYLRFFSKESRELTIAFVSSLFILSLAVPQWVQVNFLILFAWRAMADLSGVLTVPPRWVTNTLAILALALIKWQFGEFGSKEAATAFLLLLTALKILEMRNRWDFNFVLLLGLIVMPLQFIWTIDIWILIPTIMSLILILWTWIKRDNDGHLVEFKIPFYYLGRMLLVSMPVAVLLFLFFPRTHSPFGLTQSSSLGVSGFSGELNPGSVSELVKTSELAFRVSFFEKNPRLVDLYWVGEMLSESSDGLSWRKNNVLDESDSVEFGTKEKSYELIIEPHGKRWLFALEKTTNLTLAKAMSSGRWFSILPSSGGVFKSPLPFNKSQAFIAQRNTNLRRKPQTLEPYQNIPPLSPKIMDWVNSKKTLVKSPESALRLIYEEYSNNKFVYTLTPGATQLSLEMFFFETRQGFCEHFAGATASLLRALGVSSRVIVGYQGGTYNKYGDFWSVTQGDAHAWVEYVNSEGYWQRTDPVQVIAPLRTNLGALAFFDLPEDVRQSLASTWTPPQDFTFQLRDIWDSTQSYFENLNYQWVQFLLDFNQDSQKNYLMQFMSYAPTLLTIIIILSLMWAAFKSVRKTSSDKSIELYERFTRWTAQNGLIKHTYEGPIDFSNRVKDSFPQFSREIDSIIQTYIQTRYSKSEPSSAEIAEAKNSFQRLKRHRL